MPAMCFAIQERYYHPLSAFYRELTVLTEPIRRGVSVCKSLWDLAKGAVYLTSAGISRCLGAKRLASRLFSQSFYHVQSAATSLLATYHFGSRLVAHSRNLPDFFYYSDLLTPNPHVRASLNSFDVSPEETSNDNIFRIGHRRFRKDQFDLDDWKGGICAGICADFLSHYFKSSLPSAEAFIQTTHRYTYGALEKAVFSQYFNNSSIDRHLDPSLTLYDNVRLQNSCEMGKIHQLFADDARISERSYQTVQEHLSRLPEGIYRVHIDGRAASSLSRFLIGDEHGHFLIYYKSAERSFAEMSFIFDPNFGTIRLSQNDHASGFMQVLSAYHPIIRWENMGFVKAFSRTHTPTG